jgi:hypothetical protein
MVESGQYLGLGVDLTVVNPMIPYGGDGPVIESETKNRYVVSSIAAEAVDKVLRREKTAGMYEVGAGDAIRAEDDAHDADAVPRSRQKHVFSHCHPGDSLRLMGAHMSSHVVATAVAASC